MRYFKNFTADSVVREDDHGNRFVKTWFNFNHPDNFIEYGPAHKQSKTAYGGVGYGEFHILEPITKEEYESYGITWAFENDPQIKLLK